MLHSREGIGDDMGNDETTGLIPLVIGVTGHRNPAPECVADLEAAVERILGELDALAPRTPFTLLTPLARGCDRIAARVALRYRRRTAGMGIEVVAVLPFRADDYRQDFAGDPADAREFEELLSKTSARIELPARESAVLDERGFVRAGDERDLHYRRLGLYVALQSQVVIAMWDGVSNGKVGGTAEVVDFCRGKRTAEADCGIPYRRRTLLLAAPDSAPIVCVPTQREVAGSPTLAAIDRKETGISDELAERVSDLNHLNLRLLAVDPGKGWSEQVEIDGSSQAAEPWNRMVIRARRLDALATAAKRAYLRSARLIPLIAAAGVISFQWYSSFAASFPAHAWLSLLAYFAGLALAFGLWWHNKKRNRIEWTFVHARALAEAMRIQLAWTGSGVDELALDLYPVRRTADVRALRANLRAAILECAAVTTAGGIGNGTEPARRWIREQAKYFEDGSPQMAGKRRSVRNFRRWKAFTGSCVIFLSVLLLLVSLLESRQLAGLVEETAATLCFLIGIALACAVAIEYFRGAVLAQEDLDSARRMHDAFVKADALLAGGASDAREVIRAIGKEALEEHAEWFVRHENQLKPPSAG